MENLIKYSATKYHTAMLALVTVLGISITSAQNQEQQPKPPPAAQELTTGLDDHVQAGSTWAKERTTLHGLQKELEGKIRKREMDLVKENQDIRRKLAEMDSRLQELRQETAKLLAAREELFRKTDPELAQLWQELRVLRNKIDRTARKDPVTAKDKLKTEEQTEQEHGPRE